LAAAEIALAAAQDGLRRQKALTERGVGIQLESYEGETRVADATAQLARARAAVGFVGAGPGGEVTVRAPIAAQILDRRASIGSSVGPGSDPLVVIGDPSALWVVVDVFERDLPFVREGAAVSLRLSGVADPTLGRVEAVGAAVHLDRRRAPVFVSLPDTTGLRLRPGMYAQASITADPLDGVSLPVHAVLVKDGHRSVVCVEREPGVFEAREVAVGRPGDLAGTNHAVPGNPWPTFALSHWTPSWQCCPMRATYALGPEPSASDRRKVSASR
jgi:membrane fusion protein, heavy metal efflux system